MTIRPSSVDEDHNNQHGKKDDIKEHTIILARTPYSTKEWRLSGEPMLALLERLQA